jgi:hypothetical protein
MQKSPFPLLHDYRLMAALINNQRTLFKIKILTAQMPDILLSPLAECFANFIPHIGRAQQCIVYDNRARCIVNCIL